MMKYVGIVDSDLRVPIGLDWNPDGKSIAVRGTGGVSLFSNLLHKIASLKMPENEESTRTQFNSVAWNSEGTKLAGARSFGTVVVWDIASGNIEHGLNFKLSFIKSAKWYPDGTRMACAGDKGTIQIWETTTEQLLATLTSPYRQGILERIADFLIFEGPPKIQSYGKMES